MSREIKFRCWNNCLREYIPKKELMENFAEYLEEDHLYIEQYTGLKDKNDKEIYEGDILRRSEEGGFDIVGGVEWSEKAARFWVKRYYYPNGNKWEMIGNIHENPELLGGEE